LLYLAIIAKLAFLIHCPLFVICSTWNCLSHFGEQHDTQANAHHLLWGFEFCDVCEILVFMDFKED
jgi:hypothetical protein